MLLEINKNSVKMHWLLLKLIDWSEEHCTLVLGSLRVFFIQWVEKYISIIVKVIENKVYFVISKEVNMLNKLDFCISILFASVAKYRDKYSDRKSMMLHSNEYPSNQVWGIGCNIFLRDLVIIYYHTTSVWTVCFKSSSKFSCFIENRLFLPFQHCQ